MKVVCIVQARSTSERFPCKIFATLHGKPMLSHVLERASCIVGVDQVVLAVPANDLRIVHRLWADTCVGSEKDVLGRYKHAATLYEADIIVRVTADCPLLAPDLVSAVVDVTRAMKQDFPNYFPMCQPYFPVADGWDAEVFTMSALVLADKHATENQREHVTTWMREHLMLHNPIYGTTDHTELKCSVDTREDLRRVETIMNHLTDRNDFTHKATWEAWERAGRP